MTVDTHMITEVSNTFIIVTMPFVHTVKSYTERGFSVTSEYLYTETDTVIEKHYTGANFATYFGS